MNRVLITYSTSENYYYLINLLNNLEKYGNRFRYVNLKLESKLGNETIVPELYSIIFNKYKKYCSDLNFEISAIINLIHRLDLIYKKFKPDTVIIFGNKFDNYGGVLFDFSKLKKLNIYFSENLPVPGTFYINKKPRWEFIKENKPIDNIVNKEEYSKLVKRGKEISNKILKELPTRHHFNKLDNTHQAFKSKKTKVLILGSDLVGHALLPIDHPYKKNTFPIFNNYSELIDYMCNIKNIDVWLKPHPAIGFEKYYDKIAKRDNFYLFSTTDDPNTLIEKSDIVIASLSKLEINAFALNKPLIYLGTGWFWSQGYTIDCNSKEEILKSILDYIKLNKFLNKRYNTYAILAWYEKNYINFYDYCSKKELTSDYKQIEKFHTLLNLEKKQINLNISQNYIQNRIKYFKKLKGWQKPENRLIVLIKYFLKKIYLFNLLKKIFKK